VPPGIVQLSRDVQRLSRPPAVTHAPRRALHDLLVVVQPLPMHRKEDQSPPDPVLGLIDEQHASAHRPAPPAEVEDRLLAEEGDWVSWEPDPTADAEAAALFRRHWAAHDRFAAARGADQAYGRRPYGMRAVWAWSMSARRGACPWSAGARRRRSCGG
jgi:hypothetical protein